MSRVSFVAEKSCRHADRARDRRASGPAREVERARRRSDRPLRAGTTATRSRIVLPFATARFSGTRNVPHLASTAPPSVHGRSGSLAGPCGAERDERERGREDEPETVRGPHPPGGASGHRRLRSASTRAMSSVERTPTGLPDSSSTTSRWATACSVIICAARCRVSSGCDRERGRRCRSARGLRVEVADAGGGNEVEVGDHAPHPEVVGFGDDDAVNAARRHELRDGRQRRVRGARQDPLVHRVAHPRRLEPGRAGCDRPGVHRNPFPVCPPRRVEAVHADGASAVRRIGPWRTTHASAGCGARRGCP